MGPQMSSGFAAATRMRSAFARLARLNTAAFVLCLSLTLVGIEAWQMWHARETNLHSARIVTASLSESVANQVETTLRTADTVIATLVQRAEVDGVDRATLDRLYGVMTSLGAALPAIHEMGLTDKDGNAIVKSLVAHPVGLNYRERDYFRYLSTHDTRDVFIGAPVRSKIDGSLNITVSRRYNARDGSFAGVVVSSVSMEFFRRLFESLQSKSGSAISLIGQDQMLLAASPASFGEGEFAALAAAPADALEYRSPHDGVRRVGSYSPLAHYPMTAVVAQDSGVILQQWYAQLRLHGAIVLAILTIIGVLGYRLDRANRAVRMQALRDALTGLANRRCFNDTIEQEFARATRHRAPLALIMMDIDLFKSFNDRYGHPAGDACLRAVGAAVQGVLRRTGDLGARYGGEELAILLPATDLADATQIFRDVEAAVRSLAIPHAASPHGVVTLSAGLAVADADRAIASIASLIDAADAALYAAKADGRNTFAVDRGAAAAPASSPAACRNAA
jgi:diguanylate cyclase (GGDEF)-like protein